MSNPWADEWINANVTNPSNVEYKVKTKVEQVVEDGIVRYQTYEVMQIKIPVDKPLNVTNGDMNMVEGGSKVNIASSQKIDQIVKDLDL